MKESIKMNSRVYSVAGLVFFFAYLMSFIVDGRIMSYFVELYDSTAWIYISCGIGALFAGLLTIGIFSKDLQKSRSVMVVSMFFCTILNGLFFVSYANIRFAILVVLCYATGCAVASWGFFLKAFTARENRLQSCAFTLIVANILMLFVKELANYISPYIETGLSMAFLIVGSVFILLLPVNVDMKKIEVGSNKTMQLRKPIALLVAFVIFLYASSGLFLQMFKNMHNIIFNIYSWYGAIPYICVIASVYFLRKKIKWCQLLYTGIIMVVASYFIIVQFGGNAFADILAINLTAGALGIFDLLLWSVLSETMDFFENATVIFGLGLSARTLGSLSGQILGVFAINAGFHTANTTVIALCLVCISLVLIPTLVRNLTWLRDTSDQSAKNEDTLKQRRIDKHVTEIASPLTYREDEVLRLLLQGKSNHEIAEALFISENTVKTHVKNIFAKYKVKSRMELVCCVINQTYEVPNTK